MSVFSRSNPAAGRRRASVPEAPPVPHAPAALAPAALTPTDLAAGHPYLPSTAPWLRETAMRLRAEARGLDSQATTDLGLAARKRDEADDLDRLATLAELDRVGELPADLTPAAFPAAAVRPGCPCGCTTQACLYCDEQCACMSGGANCTTCSAMPRLGAGAATWTTQQPLYHFSDGSGSVPPCASAEREAWTTGDQGAVTCPSCRAWLADQASAQQPWIPTSAAAAAGWDEPLPAPPLADSADTLTLPAAGGAR